MNERHWKLRKDKGWNDKWFTESDWQWNIFKVVMTLLVALLIYLFLPEIIIF